MIELKLACKECQDGYIISTSKCTSPPKPYALHRSEAPPMHTQSYLEEYPKQRHAWQTVIKRVTFSHAMTRVSQQFESQRSIENYKR